MYSRIPRVRRATPYRPRCARHPWWAAEGTCHRCGIFFCNEDRFEVEGQDYCKPCSTHPEVDYVEAFRRKHWGRPDFWAWYYLLTTPLCVLSAQWGIESRQFLSAFSDLFRGWASLCFWLGMPFARYALLAHSIVTTAYLVYFFGLYVPPSVLLTIPTTLGVCLDVRNQLFFELEVPRDKLRRAWELRANNALARLGFRLGCLGLLLPVFAPVALLCAMEGLGQVDPTARPPIGRKKQAQAGVLLGAVGTVWGSVLLVFYWEPVIAWFSP